MAPSGRRMYGLGIHTLVCVALSVSGLAASMYWHKLVWETSTPLNDGSVLSSWRSTQWFVLEEFTNAFNISGFTRPIASKLVQNVDDLLGQASSND